MPPPNSFRRAALPGRSRARPFPPRCRLLETCAKDLEDLGHPRSPTLHETSAAYRECIDVPSKRTASTTRRGGGKSAGSYSRNVRSLLSQRDEQAGEIAMLLSRKSTPSRFVKKAETLLTRYWARADWQAREEILRTVRWLLSMARLESVKPPLNRRKTKRARRTLVQA